MFVVVKTAEDFMHPAPAVDIVLSYTALRNMAPSMHPVELVGSRPVFVLLQSRAAGVVSSCPSRSLGYTGSTHF